jgi:hypothetical protein
MRLVSVLGLLQFLHSFLSVFNYWFMPDLLM